ncbi:hypothetical protein FRB98_007295 [Tulasnella sp. 332]|nr:hypothetical protein FRB98_007295 [Tulasnella sp. 332]
MPFEDITLNDGRKALVQASGSNELHPSINPDEYSPGSHLKGTGGLAGHDASAYITQALYAGFSHIDTAQMYRNEESVGIALRQSGMARSDVWITTKYYGSGGSEIKEALVESLKKMGLSYVDLYLIHWPEPVKDLKDTWSQYELVKKEGLAKSIGVSNFKVKDLELLKRHSNITPAVNQINFSPYQLREMSPVLDYCKEHKIVVEAYGSLAPLTKNPGGPVDKPIKKAAERLNATPGQILFSWARQKGIVIVTTTTKNERLHEYLDVADLPALTQEEIKEIDDAGLKGGPSKLHILVRDRLKSTRDAATNQVLMAEVTLMAKMIIILLLMVITVNRYLF